MMILLQGLYKTFTFTESESNEKSTKHQKCQQNASLGKQLFLTRSASKPRQYRKPS